MKRQHQPNSQLSNKKQKKQALSLSQTPAQSQEKKKDPIEKQEKSETALSSPLKQKKVNKNKQQTPEKITSSPSTLKSFDKSSTENTPIPTDTNEETNQLSNESSTILTDTSSSETPSTQIVVGKIPKTLQEKETQSRLIVVLEAAFLETGKVGKDFQLLNCDDHQNILRKMGKNFADARPDITHQCLLNLLDSPLNQSGLLQVYIHTQKNDLIEVHPQIRIPRTFKRFSGLFVQLLHKLSIRATNGPDKLLKLVKTPVTQYFPQGNTSLYPEFAQYGGCPKIGTSYSSKDLHDLNDFAIKHLPPRGPVVFVIGAFSHGKVEVDYVHKEIAISQFPLSAALVASKLCSAFERKWNIL